MIFREYLKLNKNKPYKCISTYNFKVKINKKVVLYNVCY